MPPKVRARIKQGLAQCTDGERAKFMRIYSWDAGLDLDTVVDRMPAGQLDRARDQVERTLERRRRAQPEPPPADLPF